MAAPDIARNQVLFGPFASCIVGAPTYSELADWKRLGNFGSPVNRHCAIDNGPAKIGWPIITETIMVAISFFISIHLLRPHSLGRFVYLCHLLWVEIGNHTIYDIAIFPFE